MPKKARSGPISQGLRKSAAGCSIIVRSIAGHGGRCLTFTAVIMWNRICSTAGGAAGLAVCRASMPGNRNSFPSQNIFLMKSIVWRNGNGGSRWLPNVNKARSLPPTRHRVRIGASAICPCRISGKWLSGRAPGVAASSSICSVTGRCRNVRRSMGCASEHERLAHQELEAKEVLGNEPGARRASGGH